MVVDKQIARDMKIFGTKKFNVSPATLAAGASVIVDFADGQDANSSNGMNKYAPFEFIKVVNNSSDAIKIYPNTNTTGEYESIPAGTIAYMGTGEAMFYSIRIEDIGVSGITAGQLTVTAWNEPYDADNRARDQATRPNILQSFMQIFRV